MMESRNVTVTYECEDCSEFEFEKSFTGMTGTRGEYEFEESGGIDNCPACDGEIETTINES